MPVKKRTKKTASKSKGFALPTEASDVAVDPKQYISMFYGPPGVGKTTFVNSLGRVLFLSTDRGTRHLNAMRVECGDWDDVLKALKALEAMGQSKVREHYDYICMDHVGDWSGMIESWVLDKHGVDSISDASYGKGWSDLKKQMYGFLEIVKRLDVGLIFVAHETIKSVKVGGVDVDKVMPDMTKQAWKHIVPLCDLVGYIGMRPVKKGGKRVEIRTLETEPRRDLYAKDRTKRDKSDQENKGYEVLTATKFKATFSEE